MNNYNTYGNTRAYFSIFFRRFSVVLRPIKKLHLKRPTFFPHIYPDRVFVNYSFKTYPFSNTNDPSPPCLKLCKHPFSIVLDEKCRILRSIAIDLYPADRAGSFRQCPIVSRGFIEKTAFVSDPVIGSTSGYILDHTDLCIEFFLKRLP